MTSNTHFFDPFYDPFCEFNRLFDAAWEARVPNSGLQVQRRNDTHAATGTFHPRMDLHESKDQNEMTATFELPGMKKEDINIDIQNNRLIVSGQSNISNALDKEGYAVRERPYGRFTRTVALPIGTKPTEIKASLDDGVLTVKFPRSQPAQEATRITIS